MNKPKVSLIGEKIVEEDNHEPKKHYGVVTATVLNPIDPLLLGRIQVQLALIDCFDLMAWARVVMPMAGLGHGNYFIPNIGDQVLVSFENGDINAPYIIGSLWNAISFPPLPTPLPQIRTMRSPLGNQVVFTEAPPTVIIQNGPTPPEVVPSPPSPVGPHQTIMLTSAGTQIITSSAQIVAGENVINMTPDGITIASAGHISFTAVGAINIAASLISINGTTVNVVGGMVTIN